ncbi:hypothetical protein PLANPX_2406 [Lacipirellula parvula]|uniref:Uncharacterized protein n=1 Tax=Lacipirellula parvula TaxID=2650471 RepID=A0A5K7X7Q4_9BACT|nr:hypothetical protein PLANPX_2406 [Lacipirellula parvula]
MQYFAKRFRLPFNAQATRCAISLDWACEQRFRSPERSAAMT